MSSKNDGKPMITKDGDNKGKEVDKCVNTSKKCDKRAVGLKKAKDWDKIVKELDVEDDEDNPDVTHVFQKLYKNADEDTQRAMQKSFVESNGTTLSMDWKSVSKKFVKPYDEKNSDSDETDEHMANH